MTSTGTLTNRESEVITLWGDGLSGAQIAAKLGNTSRCAVIGFAKRLRDAGNAAFLAAEANRPPTLDRKGQVAEWIAEHDGRFCDCARALGMPANSVLSAWQRVLATHGGDPR